MADLSPEEWLELLYLRLLADRPLMDRMAEYHRGDHPLPFAPRELKDVYKIMLDRSRANFLRLVIEATEERLSVDGFRLSGDADEDADAESWRIWQANNLDADSQTAFSWALIMGRAYFSVWEGEDEQPIIRVEDPRQCIVAHEPGNPRGRLAALKVWDDEITGETRANVYLPEGVYKFRKDTHLGDWDERTDEFVANPLNIPVVPIVPLYNLPHIEFDGVSELADLTPIQDRINEMLFNEALAAWFAAYKQKWATGLEIPVDEETGEPIEPFNSAVDRLLATSNDKAKFGEFGATDLTNYIKSIESKIQMLSTVSRTPRHYLFQQGQSPSGDALRSAETGLVAKVKRKMRHFGEGIEEVMRLARMYAGYPEAPPDSEVVWRDPEYQSQGQLTDALVKQIQTGLVTRSMALERLGYSQTEIRRMDEERSRDAFRRAIERDIQTEPINLGDVDDQDVA